MLDVVRECDIYRYFKFQSAKQLFLKASLTIFMVCLDLFLYVDRDLCFQDFLGVANYNFHLVSLNARGIHDFRKSKTSFTWIK